MITFHPSELHYRDNKYYIRILICRINDTLTPVIHFRYSNIQLQSKIHYRENNIYINIFPNPIIYHRNNHVLSIRNTLRRE